MHDHSTHTIAVNILKHIAREKNKPFSHVKRLFVVKQNFIITCRFWELFHQLYPHLPYHEIYHCPGCRKFSLE